ncbi:phage tail protein [Cereibacter sphaeroides]|uniref:tail protein X n=1 Tax=Cereibacter sphaeroides TaxID=1063 RepID=UPI000F53FB1B|nr:tail protein X [Cereibacter sphaeroides]AZB63852.1 phage tail protein [Cereibacter sphaeroides]AZB68226.1 phage tail protein [Cereibacter sphaeroides]
MRYYRSKDGDTADGIAWQVYGRQDGRLVEALLEANPGLADLGPVLPAGLRLSIPDAPEPVVTQGVRLWG